jgi:hypothetical protein
LQVHNIELQNRAKTAEIVIWMKHRNCLGPTGMSVKKRWCWNPMRLRCRMQSIGILKVAIHSIQKASLRKKSFELDSSIQLGLRTSSRKI